MKRLVLLGMILAAPASAQVGGGQSGVSTSTPATNMRPFQELRNFGACFARNQPKDALRIIATQPGSAEEKSVLGKLIAGEHTTCLFGGTKMAMPGVFARGAIAEGLLGSGGVPHTYRLAAPAVGEAKDLHGVARCYTNGHRSEVRDLLSTRAGSPEEVKAVAGLWNDFRACMPGFKVRLNAPWIRFLLAEAMLRLPPETPQAGG
ncbi:hypothetical protein [Sphingomonas xinjiangensis]|uniref:Uncharacterized protein n=1 Tax=Sphingomonas xinjiangensis TaxID=643568 RepID=A0A840YNI9_9SPHN|nr:hypothetical protein [Sphingomonas xinjiangensis]MBB5709062.1 hypothetical protein [Sphingomonas xinjiangensis]